MNQLLKNDLLLILCLSIISCASSSGLMAHEDLKRISLNDGVYQGAYRKWPFFGAKSMVTIEQGKLKEIKVPKFNLFPLKRKHKKRLEKIPKKLYKNKALKLILFQGQPTPVIR